MSSIGCAGGATDLVVDLSEVTYMDSHVLHLLIRLAGAVGSVGGDVALIAPFGGIARKLLHITALDEHFVTLSAARE